MPNFLFLSNKASFRNLRTVSISTPNNKYTQKIPLHVLCKGIFHIVKSNALAYFFLFRYFFPSLM